MTKSRNIKSETEQSLANLGSMAKLREANVLDLSQVRAVVFESTGDIAVLHTTDSDQELKDWLLEGVGRE